MLLGWQATERRVRSKSRHWDQDERSEAASPEKADLSEHGNQTPSRGACAWCARCVFFSVHERNT